MILKIWLDIQFLFVRSSGSERGNGPTAIGKMFPDSRYVVPQFLLPTQNISHRNPILNNNDLLIPLRLTPPPSAFNPSDVWYIKFILHYNILYPFLIRKLLWLTRSYPLSLIAFPKKAFSFLRTYLILFYEPRTSRSTKKCR